LKAIAQRGERATKPSSSCCSKRSTLMTTPSISCSSSWRRRCHSASVLVDAEAHLREHGQHVPLRPARTARVERVHERLQVAARGHVGVDLAHAAGGGVARVDVTRFALGLHVRIQPLERGDREVHLAADLEHWGQARDRLDGERDAADRAQVRGHVLADGPIATRGGPHQAAVLVREADGEAVDLQLGAVVDVAADGAAHAAVEGPDLVLVEGVLEAEHRRAVPDLGELLRHLAAHALCRRVGRDQLRMLLFEAAEV
jgi:hypothetical protein